MRRIGVVTTSRAEYGILRPVLHRINFFSEQMKLILYVGGAHLSPEFGNTWRQIEFPIAEKVECLMSSDTPEGIAKSIGLTTYSFAQAYARTPVDILLITGDRYEAIGAALAAVPFKIPIAHLGGGDLTYGAFDEQIRHAITKLAHIHFTYSTHQAEIVRLLGEELSRIHVTGNPSLDAIEGISETGISEEYILVIFHPVTLEYENTGAYFDSLLSAIVKSGKYPVFIMPNADTAGRQMIIGIRHWLTSHKGQAHANLEPDIFHDLMGKATAMIGNSSAGLMEAPSFGLPVVNIGTRQEGRLRARNVIDVGYSADEILDGINQACDPLFRESIRDVENPYGDGHAAERIVKVLMETPLDIIVKRMNVNHS